MMATYEAGEIKYQKRDSTEKSKNVEKKKKIFLAISAKQ